MSLTQQQERLIANYLREVALHIGPDVSTSRAQRTLDVLEARIRKAVESRGGVIQDADVARALDELGEYINPLSLKDLTPHLNAYGKYLLGVGPISPAPDSPFGQVIFGKVGTAPITMWLRMPYGADQDVGGWYFYDRFRTPISLFGPRKGGTWELNEEAPEGKAAPVIRFTVNGSSIKGEWIGGGKRLPIEAGP